MGRELFVSSAEAEAPVDSVRPDRVCRAAGMTTVFEAAAASRRRPTGAQAVPALLSVFNPVPSVQGETMSTSSLASAAVPGARASSLALSLLGAALLGALIVFATGFSSISAAHNASHDMRHSNAFPCH